MGTFACANSDEFKWGLVAPPCANSDEFYWAEVCLGVRTLTTLKMGSRCNLEFKAFGLWPAAVACASSDDVEDGIKMQSRVQGLWPAGLLPLACANSDDFEDWLKMQSYLKACANSDEI